MPDDRLPDGWEIVAEINESAEPGAQRIPIEGDDALALTDADIAAADAWQVAYTPPGGDKPTGAFVIHGADDFDTLADLIDDTEDHYIGG
jgi:hypothetical protein